MHLFPTASQIHERHKRAKEDRIRKHRSQVAERLNEAGEKDFPIKHTFSDFMEATDIATELNILGYKTSVSGSDKFVLTINLPEHSDNCQNVKAG